MRWVDLLLDIAIAALVVALLVALVGCSSSPPAPWISAAGTSCDIEAQPRRYCSVTDPR